MSQERIELGQSVDVPIVAQNDPPSPVPSIRFHTAPVPERRNSERTTPVSTLRTKGTDQLLLTSQSLAVDLEAQKSASHHGPHWLSPAMMILSYLVGVSSSIAHHAYYSSLHSKQVGNDIAQQVALG
jgi:hypothetical protein